MKKLFVGNLSSDTSEDQVRSLFSEFGKVRSINLVTDIFTRECRGFGFVEMEGHEAKAAIEGLNGKSFNDKQIKVKFEVVRPGKGKRHR